MNTTEQLWWWVIVAWCCQATNHYLSQWMLPYGVTRTQWVDICCWSLCLIFYTNMLQQLRKLILNPSLPKILTLQVPWHFAVESFEGCKINVIICCRKGCAVFLWNCIVQSYNYPSPLWWRLMEKRNDDHIFCITLSGFTWYSIHCYITPKESQRAMTLKST